MKNLANCRPSEFLKQTNRIKKSVERWLNVTQIMEIRKKTPKLEDVPESATDSEKIAIRKKNLEVIKEQGKENLSLILDRILDEHPDETLELLALLNFVEPENVDDYSIEDYLQSINEIISNETVISFFISLGRLERINTQG